MTPLLLLLAACDDTGSNTDVFTLEECPEGEVCEKVADGASRFTAAACIADSVTTPWHSGDSGSPDLELAFSVAGATFLDGGTTASGTLNADQTCLQPELVAGTEESVLLTATWLGVEKELPVTLAPADVSLVYLTSDQPYFDATTIQQLTVTATVFGPDGADVSDGTMIEFEASPDPAGTGFTLSPTTTYVQSGEAQTTLVLLPGATQVSLTATVTPPTWGEVTGAALESEALIVYANPG